MPDMKTRIGISIVVSLFLAMLIYAFLNPVVVWYLDTIPQLLTNTSGNVFYEIAAMLIAVAMPLFALFLCVSSIFEVFLK